VAGVDPVCVKGWGSLFNTLRTQAHEAHSDGRAIA
jgi:hypothetical protein